jgi:mercuric ion binding protein
MLRILLTTLILVSFAACSGEKNSKQVSFKVYGNCGMCKETIEGSLEVKGIYEADWDKDSKMISIRFDSLAHAEADLHHFIASSGYDTDLERAPNEVYEDLHGCCQYERRPM